MGGGNGIWFSLGPELSGFWQAALWLCIVYTAIMCHPENLFTMRVHGKVISFLINKADVFFGSILRSEVSKGKWRQWI